ncbi:MAG: type II pantothenate kinase [Clostridia bacterium]|nr:type II pantothenate kinase [Clostridia bacterium]
MGVVIGIDVGGSTTKIVGFKNDAGAKTPLAPQFVRANDPLTSVYGAFGKFTHENGLSLTDIDKVMMAGVGSTFVTKSLYDLPCHHVSEFDSIGLGGMYLSGLSECLVVSLGTGTAIVHASKEKGIEYLGGTGVGGGTLVGLSKLLLKAENIEHIVELAEGGELSNIDLCIGDITEKKSMGQMPADLTASNFGNVSDLATKNDIARGILNLVFETVGMVAIFAAKARGVRDIVLTGNLTHLSYCREKAEYFNGLERTYGVHFLIPELAQFSTVIGTALQG